VKKTRKHWVGDSKNSCLSWMFFFLVACADSSLAAADANVAPIRFAPTAGVKASLLVHEHEVDISVTGAHGESRETVVVETEKNLKINLEDYNFDGHMDFSISHVDGGMGTYDVHQVYVYSVEQNKFVQLTPKCGDEFINLVVDKRSRTLLSSYVVNNRYMTCKMSTFVLSEQK